MCVRVSVPSKRESRLTSTNFKYRGVLQKKNQLTKTPNSYIKYAWFVAIIMAFSFLNNNNITNELMQSQIDGWIKLEKFYAYRAILNQIALSLQYRLLSRGCSMNILLYLYMLYYMRGGACTIQHVIIITLVFTYW